MKLTRKITSSLFIGIIGISSIAFTPSALALGPSNVFSVSKVAPWDKLNMREYPGSSAPIIYTIPSNGKGIEATGEEAVVNDTVWVRASWAKRTGWINKDYLQAMEKVEPKTTVAQKPKFETDTLECGGTEPFWNIDISNNQMKINVLDGKNYDLALSFRAQSRNDTSIAVVGAVNEKDVVNAYLQKTMNCSDGMSDIKYPYEITALINKKKSIQVAVVSPKTVTS